MKYALAICLLSSLAFGKSFDHVGAVVYHEAKLKNLVEGRTDLYYVDDYTCTPGTDHYAPMCRKTNDWYVTESEAFAEVSLEDGTKIIVTDSVCNRIPFKNCAQTEPWNHELRTVRTHDDFWGSLSKLYFSKQTAFSYRVRSTKAGDIIDIKGIKVDSLDRRLSSSYRPQ